MMDCQVRERRILPEASHRRRGIRRLTRPLVPGERGQCGGEPAVSSQPVVETEWVAALRAHQQHDGAPLLIGPVVKPRDLRDERGKRRERVGLVLGPRASVGGAKRPSDASGRSFDGSVAVAAESSAYP